MVERLDLRLPQLRNLDGELISIPNSAITMVKNKSNSWARVNLGVNVAYDTDLDDALAVIKAASTQMSQDVEWQPLILEPPEVLGVDSFNDSSITIRLLMRTAPAQQWLVARELRRRRRRLRGVDGRDVLRPDGHQVRHLRHRGRRAHRHEGEHEREPVRRPSGTETRVSHGQAQSQVQDAGAWLSCDAAPSGRHAEPSKGSRAATIAAHSRQQR